MGQIILGALIIHQPQLNVFCWSECGFPADQIVLRVSASNDIKTFVVKQKVHGVYFFIMHTMKVPSTRIQCSVHHTVTRDSAEGYSVRQTTLTGRTCCIRSDACGFTALWTNFYNISTSTRMKNDMGNTKWYFRIFLFRSVSSSLLKNFELQKKLTYCHA